MTRLHLYSRFERFWHWTQALLILALIWTGFEIHGTLHVIGFQKAQHAHNILVWALIALIAFAIFWHFITGQWRQYIPTFDKVIDMVKFYTGGIFRGAPHPTKKTELSKLNPLQRLTYLGLKVVIFPFQIGTGLLYYFYHDLPQWGIHMKLQTVAGLHVGATFVMLAFVIVHVYLTTTGHTVFTNIKAMITGWEDVEDEEHETA